MHSLDLGGAWQVVQAGQDHPLPAQVPGCIHTDLLAAGVIDDPFYRDREDALRWIGEVDWVYRRTIDVPADLLHDARVLLRCDGLDTLATLSINGQPVATTDNMFRTWEFDAKPYLHAGENTLEVRFASTLPYIKQKLEEHHMPSWSGPKEVPGRSVVRKEPCNYGWDWGPVCITCGIWRPITLVGFSEARWTDLAIMQDHAKPGLVTLQLAATAEVLAEGAYTARVAVSLDGQLLATASSPLQGGAAELRLPLANPRLWWPNGMGAQPLYTVQCELLNAAGAVLDTRTQRIGLRTLVLDRHADQWGESFQFVVNGVPYFAKGGNWIPADTFVTRLTRDDYARLLHSVADAHMNMLRVWGGGIYESDDFYELCDELGITVWQDFMFACATYPTFDEAFMANVKAEAEDNVRRLRHHPCIALWCGNNELEQGLVGDNPQYQMSWEDYSRLFDGLLADIIRELDPARAYWPCSPHSPHGDRKEHSNPQWGDAHLWDVWHGRKPFEWYRTCEHRFASEFGFQSFPEPKTVRGYTDACDRNVTSHVMEHHQRSGIGNTVIMQYMLDWFLLPNSFDHTLWLSQILHGMAMKYAVENWRRHMPRTMGTLYWQINDCWPVASWASIDYHGRWKALQYMAKKFFAPLLISGVEHRDTGAVEIHITSDLQEPVAAEIAWTLTDVEGGVLAEGRKAVQTPVLSNAKLEDLDCGAALQAHGHRALMLWLELYVDGARVSENFVSFARPKHLALREPGLSAEVTPAGDGNYLVTLTAHYPALWAWLELDEADARCSDNFVHVVPGRPVDILLQPAQPMSPAAVQAALRVRSLVDTYRADGLPLAPTAMAQAQ